MKKRFKHAVLVGKFMPAHVGHKYMIDFALNLADHVTVLVDCVPNQYPDNKIRAQWIRKQFYSTSFLTVKAIDSHTPQEPDECDNFWDVWKKIFSDNTLDSSINNGIPDVLVGSMDYCVKLSEVLSIPYVECNTERESFNISATQIRQSLHDNFDMLMPSVKSFYSKKFIFVGPESSGKTTLCKKMSHFFNAGYVGEYAKIYLKNNKNLTLEGMEHIMYAHLQSILAVQQFGHSKLFIDTDHLTTKVWSKLILGLPPSNYEEIEKEYECNFWNQHHQPIYFLIYPSLKWVKDEHRKFLSEDILSSQSFRIEFFNKIKKELDTKGLKYFVIDSDSSDKNEETIKKIIIEESA